MSRLRQGLPIAILTILAMIVVAGILLAFRLPAETVFLGAWLTMALGPSKLLDRWRGRAEAAVLLPVMSALIGVVALAFRWQFWFGAVLFTLALAASVWLRRFGRTGSRVGGLIAMPFLTLLVAPGGGGLWQSVVAGVTALAVAIAARWIAQLIRVVPPPDPELPPGESTLRPIVSTRMAIQLGLAVAVAFAVGWFLFPQHWAWVVLTAYLVQSGNRGRADVLYKSGLRVVGAAVGSLVLLLIPPEAGLPPWVALVITLAAIAVGLVLRPVSYGFWAFAFTLALATVQSALTGAQPDLLQRVLAIVVGAVISVLAAWLVLPVRSEGVVRKRIGEALAALQEQLGSPGVEHAAAVEIAVRRVDEVSRPFRFAAAVPLLPARAKRTGSWIALVDECADAGVALEAPADPETRRALGAARRAVGTPDELLAALQAVREAL